MEIEAEEGLPSRRKAGWKGMQGDSQNAENGLYLVWCVSHRVYVYLSKPNAELCTSLDAAYISMSNNNQHDT